MISLDNNVVFVNRQVKVDECRENIKNHGNITSIHMVVGLLEFCVFYIICFVMHESIYLEYIRILQFQTHRHIDVGYIKTDRHNKYTLVQKKRDQFTFSFLALTYWFNLNLRNILIKSRFFQQNHIFVFILRPIINNFLSILIKFALNQYMYMYVNDKNEQVNESRFFCTRVYLLYKWSCCSLGCKYPILATCL